jgi:peptide-methionine (S)-S-oxide reductase
MFDPNVISYEELLQVFYYTHNPTTLNQDGANFGTEYRSAIFYHDDEQKRIADDVTAHFAAELWSDPIVTEIVKLEKFYPAEDYHQNFFKNNPNQAYCQIIINPKLEKFRKKFESLLK